MATWQFQCYIIPTRVTGENLSLDEITSWEGFPLPSTDIKFLEREKSWSKDILQFGNIDETCIEFSFEKAVLEGMNCRLDLRSLTKQKLIEVINYVQEIGAMFLVEDTICPPDMEIMVEQMKQSIAYHFCKNPLGYIASLNAKKQL